MTAQKRRLNDDSSSQKKSKKAKLPEKSAKEHKKDATLTQSVSALTLEEVDFPRGGGTSLTPLEVKAIQAEAYREANEEIFKDVKADQKKPKRRKRQLESQPPIGGKVKVKKIHVEHLNYKRLTVGMKILGQIISIQPLALIISLPNQLLGHVPITEISTQLTSLLEDLNDDDETSGSEDEDQDEDADDNHEDRDSKPPAPTLSDLFHTGQYIRAVVATIHEHASAAITGIGNTRDEIVKASRKVELSLHPEKVNAGVQKSDLRSGFTLSAVVKSIEDHGFILELGVPDVSGFLSFKNLQKGPEGNERRLQIGQLVDVIVKKMSSNGRTCNVTLNADLFSSSTTSEVAKASSVLPGMLVQSLVMAVGHAGLNLQVLGFFEGTVDLYHLPPGPPENSYKVGTKIKARVLYAIPNTPPRFSLSLTEHTINLAPRSIMAEGVDTSVGLQEAYPVGTILGTVRIVRVENERGLIAEVQPLVQGYIHISHVSDHHTSSLSSNSGPWKIGTAHRARVIGHYLFDGLLQLSLRPSILEQEIFQVADLQVGEVIKGTIKKLGESGLIVTVSGNLDGVVWPDHFADISLKHPSKRFKPGAKIRCRVLFVDLERKRIVLTAKKSLIESDLPILSKFEEARIGLITLGVVVKVSEKSLVVEFYNKIKAVVTQKEASEVDNITLSDVFKIGRAIRLRIIKVDPNSRFILASVRQASPDSKYSAIDVTGIDVGSVAGGCVTEIHKDNAILTLHETKARALISFKNIAQCRGSTVSQIRETLKIGDCLDDLVVTNRNLEEGFVTVANKERLKTSHSPKNALSIENVEIGQAVVGRVIRQNQQGACMKLSARLNGILHPTDTSDNYEAGVPYPSTDTVLKGVIIGIDRSKNSATLSTRRSRLYPSQNEEVVDREIQGLNDLKKGGTVRGFIKNIAEHGLFVTLGRDIDARVQIKELFDEYVKDWKARFTSNQLVTGRILDIDNEKQQIEMTFRSGNAGRDSVSIPLSAFQEGQIVNGRVKRIEDYGLFVEIDDSKVSGLCHKSQLSDNTKADVAVALRGFREGDKVKAKILSIDNSKRRISFGLKPSYFSENESAVSTIGASGTENDPPLINVDHEIDDSSDDPDPHSGEDDEPSSSDAGDGGENVEEMHIAEDTQLHATPDTTPLRTPLSSMELGGFRWTGNATLSDEDQASTASSPSEDDGNERSDKKKRRRKQIQQDLTADMHTKQPESNADFERILLGSPSSSYLWIQYMSFQLQLSEVGKAREIGRRALETINFREEQEKLNVWVALLNLENVYGTEDSLEATFRDAIRHNDSKTIHLRLAGILDQAEKHEKAEDLYKKTCKKFGQSSKVWTLFAEYYFRRAAFEDARSLLKHGLQSLDKRKHLKTISKFAQMEYKMGDPERGRTIFEGIVDSHPKRWDLWSVYMDMEATQRDMQNLRNLFNRVLTHKMTSYKAKFFFKKWLDLEKRLGDEEGATIVKQKAVEWTQKAANSS